MKVIIIAVMIILLCTVLFVILLNEDSFQLTDIEYDFLNEFRRRGYVYIEPAGDYLYIYTEDGRKYKSNKTFGLFSNLKQGKKYDVEYLLKNCEVKK